MAVSLHRLSSMSSCFLECIIFYLFFCSNEVFLERGASSGTTTISRVCTPDFDWMVYVVVDED
jgi:hypothetical protein